MPRYHCFLPWPVDHSHAPLLLCPPFLPRRLVDLICASTLCAHPPPLSVSSNRSVIGHRGELGSGGRKATCRKTRRRRDCCCRSTSSIPTSRSQDLNFTKFHFLQFFSYKSESASNCFFYFEVHIFFGRDFDVQCWHLQDCILRNLVYVILCMSRVLCHLTKQKINFNEIVVLDHKIVHLHIGGKHWYFPMSKFCASTMYKLCWEYMNMCF